jgi:hypothetical protein
VVLTLRWLSRSVVGLPPPRPGYDPRSVHVRFVVEEVRLGQVFLAELPLMLDTDLHLRVAVARRANRLGWKPSKKERSLGHTGALNRKDFPFRHLNTKRLFPLHCVLCQRHNMTSLTNMRHVFLYIMHMGIDVSEILIPPFSV